MRVLGVLLLLVASACGDHRAAGDVDAAPRPDAAVPPDAATPDSPTPDAPPSPPDAAVTLPAVRYSVSGNHIVDGSGQTRVFHGVNRPSLEWRPDGEMLSAMDYQLMAGWKVDTVRIPLDQDFWLAAAAMHDANYVALVTQQVQWAHAAGLDVILDLHWSDGGDLGATPALRRMPDVNSTEFWIEVATRFGSDGHVLFELYNEPHDVSWDVWRDGGDAGDGTTAVGMQELTDTIRGTGATNVIIIDGLDYAYDLSGVPAHRISGGDLAYASHPYDYPEKGPSHWDADWGFLAATDAIIVTEFGDFNCQPGFYQSLIDYADARGLSWTAWAWYVNGCGFPSLISDWNGTPNDAGAAVKAALEGY